MGRLFGTDGVRGIANSELTAELAYKLGRAGAFVLTAETKHVPKILVGMDTRISGHMLEAALVAGICSVGAEAICLGIAPTPAVAYLTRHYKADAGIVISASHNPFEFNGIKFFDGKGYKLPDAIEDRIEAVILDEDGQLPFPTGVKVGVKSVREDALNDYIDFLKETAPADLKGMKIAVDCANGAAYQAAPKALLQLGADVCVIHNKPDGININDSCGSTHIESLQKFVCECDADIGLAFDGDADRVLAVDENGRLIDGDRIMAIIGLELKKRGRLTKNTIVATVMSNMGLDIMAGNHGINIAKTKVGDRYVLEEMLEKGYILGGEQSGHVIFLEHNTTGDGLLTALNLLDAMKTSGCKLSELASVMEVLPQIIKNARVKNQNKHNYMEDEIIAGLCRQLESEFNGEGRVLIRPSGTEPLVRVMIEGKDKEYITTRAFELAKVIEERLS
ncbi:MAG: phosphoglucosamine mutase [Ruminiclostridium sp.]|nr:phosphoglucosamine mutase [Ruminiclostridium sp.]